MKKATKYYATYLITSFTLLMAGILVHFDGSNIIYATIGSVIAAIEFVVIAGVSVYIEPDWPGNK